MIRTFRSKALKPCWTRNDSSGNNPDWLPKVRRQLAALDVAEAPGDLDQPGWGLHALSGPMAGRFALTVSRNWRLTFGFDGRDAIELDLEDYHGR